MLTGRFINKVNQTLSFYGTPDYDRLLKKENLEKVWNMTQSGTNYFPDDLAITNTVITPEVDGSRVIYGNDTIIIKFTRSDLSFILEALNNHLNITKKLVVIQGNGVELKNPLPEVKI